MVVPAETSVASQLVVDLAVDCARPTVGIRARTRTSVWPPPSRSAASHRWLTGLGRTQSRGAAPDESAPAAGFFRCRGGKAVGRARRRGAIGGEEAGIGSNSGQPQKESGAPANGGAGTAKLGSTEHWRGGRTNESDDGAVVVASPGGMVATSSPPIAVPLSMARPQYR